MSPMTADDQLDATAKGRASATRNAAGKVTVALNARSAQAEHDAATQTMTGSQGSSQQGSVKRTAPSTCHEARSRESRTSQRRMATSANCESLA